MDLKGNGYRLVFEENFDGGMETNKWKALDETVKAHSAKDNKETVPTHVNTQAASKHAGAELHYIPENVCCENGELVIRADRDGDVRADTLPDAGQSADGLPVSGGINGDDFAESAKRRRAVAGHFRQ